MWTVIEGQVAMWMMLKVKSARLMQIHRFCIMPHKLPNGTRQREVNGNHPMNSLHRLQEATTKEREDIRIVTITVNVRNPC